MTDAEVLKTLSTMWGVSTQGMREIIKAGEIPGAVAIKKRKRTTFAYRNDLRSELSVWRDQHE